MSVISFFYFSTSCSSVGRRHRIQSINDTSLSILSHSTHNMIISYSLSLSLSFYLNMYMCMYVSITTYVFNTVLPSFLELKNKRKLKNPFLQKKFWPRGIDCAMGFGRERDVRKVYRVATECCCHGLESTYRQRFCDVFRDDRDVPTFPSKSPSQSF